MQTEIVSPEDLSRAVLCLKRGEPIAFPTETVYGLGASVFDPAGIQRIFTIKGRPADNPLIAHIGSIEEASLLADDLPPAFFRLAEAFWPGPLALVVRKRDTVPSVVSAGHPTIAIRMPMHPIALKLIRAVGAPLAAPSANLSGRPSPTTAQDVLEDLAGKIPLIIDGGPSAIGIESTVLSLISSRPTLLRPGFLTREQLEAVLGYPIDLPTASTPILSPGMKYRHYAPKARVRLVFSESDVVGPYSLRDVTARNLYAELRKADRLGSPEVEIYCPPAVQADAALMNRLLRASTDA